MLGIAGRRKKGEREGEVESQKEEEGGGCGGEGRRGREKSEK